MARMAKRKTSARQPDRRRHALARKIVGVALQEKWQRGHHLVELDLVKRLGVSRTPVRSALRLLAGHGVLEARQNHGYFLIKDPSDLARIDLPAPRTADEELYIGLIADRVRGGDKSFTLSDVMRRYSASRSVAQRTVNRMADEGLVARNAGQGWSFMPTLDSIQSRRASYEFRLALEPAAIRASSFAADPETLRRQRIAHLDLLDAVERGSAERTKIYEVDAGFHEAIVAFSGNQFFISAVSQQNRLRHILELWDGGNLARVAEWCHEHLAVIDALARGDREAAATAMEAHLTTAARGQPTGIASRRSASPRINRNRRSHSAPGISAGMK